MARPCPRAAPGQANQCPQLAVVPSAELRNRNIPEQRLKRSRAGSIRLVRIIGKPLCTFTRSVFEPITSIETMCRLAKSMLTARGNTHLCAQSWCSLRSSHSGFLTEVFRGAPRPGCTTSRLQRADAARSCDLHISSAARSSRFCSISTCAANQDLSAPANDLHGADSTAGSDRLASGNSAQFPDSTTRSATQLLDAQHRIRKKQEEDQGRQPYSLVATQVISSRLPAAWAKVTCACVQCAARVRRAPALYRLHCSIQSRKRSLQNHVVLSIPAGIGKLTLPANWTVNLLTILHVCVALHAKL